MSDDFLDINSNQTRSVDGQPMMSDEEQILDKFVIINVLNDFIDHQAKAERNLGYLSELEVKKHMDVLRAFQDFQAMDVDKKIRTVLDLVIGDREKKIETLNEVMDTETFLFNLDLPNAYGVYMNSLDKTKKDFENVLINRLGMLNGDLNQVLTEVQMGRLKTALSRAKETSRTLTPYRDAPTVDDASPRDVFRLVFQKFRDTQPDNYMVLGTMMHNEMSACLKACPEEALTADEKKLLPRLTIERCTDFSKAWTANKIIRPITYDDFIYLMNNHDGSARFARFMTISCSVCYQKCTFNKIFRENKCQCIVCFFCVIKTLDEQMKGDNGEEARSFECPKCKSACQISDQCASLRALWTKLSSVAGVPEKPYF